MHRIDKALAELSAAWAEVKNAPPSELVALQPTVLAEYQTLASTVGCDSVSALLEAIAKAGPLMQRVGEFLVTPTVDASPGLPEIIIRPESPVSQGIARIGLCADAVTVLFPEKRDDFLDVVKGAGYTWTGGVWQKSIKGWGEAANAAAELGHRLLTEGFWISPPTPDIRDAIIEESFDPEQRRKVMARIKGQYAGWLVLWWARSEDCYAAARRISGSRYDKPVVVVPPEFYDEVEDFAAQHGFFISPAAQDLIDQARATLDAALLVQVEVVAPEEDDGGFPELPIPETTGIDNELADHD